MDDEIMSSIRLGIVVTEGADTRCAKCRQKVDETKFRSDKAIKQFQVSQLCQKCQDMVFGKTSK